MEFTHGYLGPHCGVFAVPAPDPVGPSLNSGEIGSAHTQKIKGPVGDKALYKNCSPLRKLATILLLTVFCNSFFYYGYFSFSLLKAKLAAKLALAKMNPQASFDILKVPVCQLEKDESDEVWYGGKLYDVVQRDRINDTLYVFLLRDEQEQNVLTCNQKYFRDNGSAGAYGGHEVTAINKAPTVTDTENMSNYPPTLAQRDYLFKA